MKKDLLGVFEFLVVDTGEKWAIVEQWDEELRQASAGAEYAQIRAHMDGILKLLNVAAQRAELLKLASGKTDFKQ